MSSSLLNHHDLKLAQHVSGAIFLPINLVHFWQKSFCFQEKSIKKLCSSFSSERNPKLVFCSTPPMESRTILHEGSSVVYLLSVLNTLVFVKCARESECLFHEDLRSRERTSLVLGPHFSAERGHKTMGNSMSLYQTIDINYSLMHTGAQNCCAPKCLVQSIAEIHPGCASATLSIHIFSQMSEMPFSKNVSIFQLRPNLVFTSTWTPFHT